VAISEPGHTWRSVICRGAGRSVEQEQREVEEGHEDRPAQPPDEAHAAQVEQRDDAGQRDDHADISMRPIQGDRGIASDSRIVWRHGGCREPDRRG